MTIVVKLPTNDLTSSVERPVVLDIIGQMQELTQISNLTEIRYYGPSGKAIQIGYGMGDTERSPNKWPHQKNVRIEVRDGFEDHTVFAVSSVRSDAPAVFYDAALGVAVAPIYTVSQIEVTVSYSASDENEATRWQNNFKEKFAGGRAPLVHKTQYAYHVPPEFCYILEQIHKLREAQGGYGEDLNTWCGKCSDNRMTVLTNESKTYADLVIVEQQCEIIGGFDFDVIPERATLDTDTNLWETSFVYRFAYSKPTSVRLQYPPVIHNQVLSKKLRPEAEIAYQPLYKASQDSIAKLGYYRSENETLRNIGNRGLDIPAWSAFRPKNVLGDTCRVFSALTLITPEDRRSLLNLNQLSQYNLHRYILAFLAEGEHRFITTTFQSIVQLTLYVDGNPVENGITVDAALNVSAKVDLDVRKTYHVRMSLVTQLSHLPTAALKRLKANTPACVLILQALNCRSKDNNQFPRFHIYDNQLNGLGLKRVDDLIVPTDEEYPVDLRGHGGLRWALVETLFVRTQPKT